MDLDSALLRAFVALADELHFGRAADALFISQQGLSKRIKRLEALLGSALFSRDRRSVELTDAGQRLLPEARKAVDAVDTALAAITTKASVLTVDVLDEHLTMLPRVRELASSRPDLVLSTVMRHGGRTMDVLRKGAADVVLGRPGHVQAPWPSDIRGRPVFAEPIQLLLPVGHRLDRRSVTLAELADEPLWFPTASAPAEWTDLLDELAATFHLRCDQTGATFGFQHWLEQVSTGLAAPTLVGAGMQLPRDLPLARVDIVDPTPVFWWWAMWRVRRPAAGIAQLITLLIDETPVLGEMWLPAGDDAHPLTLGVAAPPPAGLEREHEADA